MPIILRAAKGSPLTNAEIDGNFTQLQSDAAAATSLAAAVQSALTVHGAASDPHPQYQTQTESDARYVRTVAGQAPDGSGNVSITSANVSDFTEATQDVIGSMVAAAGGSYNDAAGTITLPSGGSGATNLSFSVNASAVTVNSDTGTDAVLPAAVAGVSAGVLSASDKSKLDGVAAGATANSSDATLLARANHTGSQPASTISDFTEASQDVIGAMVQAAGGTYNDTAGTITLPGATDASSSVNGLVRLAGALGGTAAAPTALGYADAAALTAVLNTKATTLAPVTLTGATSLTAAAHANRQIIFNGANANLTIQSDGSGGTSADDSFEIHTATGSPGVPTLILPDSSTIVGGPNKIIGATRKGANSWTAGTTDPAPATMAASAIVAAIDSYLGSNGWQGGVMSGSAIVTAINAQLGSNAWQAGAAGTVPVTVSGSAVQGSLLTATIASGWVGTGYQWTRNGANISGATSSTYTTQVADIGNSITCVVTGLPYIAQGTTVTGSVATLSSAVVENAAASSLVLTFSAALTSSNPTGAGGLSLVFSVGSTATVTAVAVSGTTVTCTLSRAIVHTDVFTLSYTSGSSSQPFANANGNVANFSSVAVTNNVAPGGSFQLIDTFDGGSKDTTKFLDPTTAPFWDSAATIGGTDTQSGGVATITPTSSAEVMQGRRSLSETVSLLAGRRFAVKLNSSSFGVNGALITIGFAKSGGENCRWQLFNNFGTVAAEAICFNFGSSGTLFSGDATGGNAANYRWLSIRTDSTTGDIVMESAPDASGSPGTWTERRRILASAGEFFTLSGGYVGVYAKNSNAGASPAPMVIEELFVTDV